MKVDFPNSANVRALERFVLGGGRWKRINIPVRYGMFTHPSAGRCLVDTGYSERVTQRRRSLPLWLYSKVLKPKLTANALPVAHSDINVILLTHLHADHISALKDYPDAILYGDRRSADKFLSSSRFGRLRHGMFQELLPENFIERLVAFEDLAQVEAPLGLGMAADIFGDASVLAVPLPGHMAGHTGIVWTHGARPLLYAADTEWMFEAIVSDRPPGLPARLILDDLPAARESAARIRRFVDLGGDVALCHDPEVL